MTNPRRAKGGGWAVLALGVLVVLPMLYVLSVGPAGRFAQETGRGEDAFQIVYAPIRCVANWSLPFADALFWYLELWGIEVEVDIGGGGIGWEEDGDVYYFPATQS
jgi:hypothetical protein